MRSLVCVIIFASLLSNVLGNTRQRVSVKGKLFCGAAPASNIRVKLVDDDRGPNPDDQLDAGYTNNNGEFQLAGEESEATSIDTVVKIYHDCDDGIIPCQRKWKLWVPDRYINGATFDLGTLNLEARMNDEERDCIHKFF